MIGKALVVLPTDTITMGGRGVKCVTDKAMNPAGPDAPAAVTAETPTAREASARQNSPDSMAGSPARSLVWDMASTPCIVMVASRHRAVRDAGGQCLEIHHISVLLLHVEEIGVVRTFRPVSDTIRHDRDAKTV